MFNSGSINDTNDTSSRAYKRWGLIIRRCYDRNKSTYNTYDNCKVSEYFLTFSNFKAFYDENHVDGYSIDKDIIGCGNVYDIGTCIFVPSWVNNFVVGFSRRTNKEPKTGKFKCQVRDPFIGKRLTVGRFDTEIEAKKSLAMAKIKMVEDNRIKFTSIREDLADLVVKKIKRDLNDFIH